MVPHYSTDPMDQKPDDGFSFTDVTMLAFLAISTLAVVVLLLLGTACAATRIEAALGLA